MRQLGTDRVLEILFSAGEFALYLEFYAGGNVVLVDKTGVVVAVLRVVKGSGEDGGGVGECKVGARYEASQRTAGGDLHVRVVAAFEAAALQADEAEEGVVETPAVGAAGKKFKKKKKKKGEEGVKKVLAARMTEFSPTLIEHCFCLVGVDPEMKAGDALAGGENVRRIVEAFREAERIVKDIIEDKDGQGIKGYIIAKLPRQHSDPAGGYKREKQKGVSFGPSEAPPKGVSFGNSEAVEQEQQVEKIQEEGEGKGMVYDDFFPFLPRQFEGVPGVKCLEFTGFNHTVDTFFSSIESQKLTSRIVERELAATKRLASAHADHARRVEGLRDLQELNVLKAQAIEANLDRVEEVIAAVNGLVAQGMDWAAISQLIDGEQKRGNPIAELVKLPLKLFENTVTVTLSEQEPMDDDDDDDDASASEDSGSEEETSTAPKKPLGSTLDIDIDLSLSAYANASLYFTQKKTLLAKESKTLQSSTKALKSTSRKIAADLRKGLKQEKELLRPVRPAAWFEKFLFFLSSDGYLVLAGRDLQQNEILYKRYFRRGDVFVSADEPGAAVVVVRNNAAGAPVPPSTLGQAGTLAVATSAAWERKSVVAGWWVLHDQVRKTDKTGEYLPPGVFEITGKKTYLPPAHLVLGYGVLWMVDEEGRKRHGRHRMEEGEKADAMEAVDGGDKVEQEVEEVKQEAEEQEEEEEEEEEESDDEEFPDAQIESAGEEEEEAEGNRAESEDEEFPDAEVTQKDSDGAASEDEQNTAPPAGAHPSGSKHLTAKAHRDLKKARAAGISISASPTTPHEIPAAPKPNTPAPKPEPAIVRRKKGKQKKQATKYAHQDAADRALAMEVLGSAAAAAKAATSAAATAAREAELAFQKARRREQHLRAAREGLKAEEARRRQAPDDDDDGDDNDPSMAVPLDSYIGTPMVGDTLLAAIPVCAPWGAMGRFKYRAKLQPGSVKKGKAVKDVVSRWLADAQRKVDVMCEDVEKPWPSEVELIRGWKEAEIVSYLALMGCGG